MFREMRRKNQLLSDSETAEILKNGPSGVLSLIGDGGYPYSVPLSYVFCGSKIYFHSAKQGHKIDAIKSCPKASFCVIEKDSVVPEKYTTYFRSAIVFGNVRILESEDEIKSALEVLSLKYHPLDSEQNRADVISKELSAVSIIELSIEHMTGKEAKELAAQKKDAAQLI